MSTFLEQLNDWTDVDFAEFELAKSLGIMACQHAELMPGL